MIDELMARIQTRFRTYVESGRSDHSLVLSDEAEDEARELWREEIATKTAITQTARPGVLEALAWLHWARYNALPQGVDRNDLQAAVIFFAIIYMVYPDGVPDQLRELLDSGHAPDVQDALGIPAQHPSSYVSDQYPSAVERYLAIVKEITPVSLPSEEKPDINGLREGDRVRLIKAFEGETSYYEVGKEGTVLVTKTSPADISVGRELDFHEVVIDGGGLIMVSGTDIQKIPGHAKVIYSDDGENVRIITNPEPITEDTETTTTAYVYNDSFRIVGRVASDGQIWDDSFRIVGRVASDGQIWDDTFRIVGRVASDGQIWDDSFRIIGKVDAAPLTFQGGSALLLLL
jgi:YD repeat-containing protein